ncbi:MAG: nicotinate (nicotinamide) nucleotide adenylyltransferase [Deltaproteobacteria bacterium]|jgi:nicotinate-nucleotide adenylyltransferase|nr:nicotinate (nicotinamide) nucleotide adenylyltransferase [Deltaproteobacteria bacterium]
MQGKSGQHRREASVSGAALLGGSFNPLHFGHLRLAVEVFEALRPERLEFVPCANPPHKRREKLLPFALRYAMLREALAACPHFQVNPLEAEMPAPSFTCAMLRAYRERHDGTRLYFILGSEDFSGLDSWKDWRELPRLATLVVAARQGGDKDEFRSAVRRFWPEAEGAEEWPDAGDEPAFVLPGGGKVSYLPLPRLDINASLLRARWLAGRSIDFFTPDAVLEFLDRQADTVRAYWGSDPR